MGAYAGVLLLASLAPHTLCLTFPPCPCFPRVHHCQVTLGESLCAIGQITTTFVTCTTPPVPSWPTMSTLVVEQADQTSCTVPNAFVAQGPRVGCARTDGYTHKGFRMNSRCNTRSSESEQPQGAEAIEGQERGVWDPAVVRLCARAAERYF